jgi:hypothetical protein
MSAIARELHEVLEEEYVRTGGEILPSPDEPFTEADLLNLEAAADRLGKKPDADEVLSYLNELRDKTGDKPGPLSLADVKLLPATERLRKDYSAYDEPWRLRINRRMLEDILGDSLRGAKAWTEITADQIVDADACRAALVSADLPGPYTEPYAIAKKLEELCCNTDFTDPFCPAKRFEGWSQLSCNSNVLIDAYETFVETEERRTVNRRILDDVFGDGMLRSRDVHLSRIYGELHKRKPDEARTALCISGGGIRSATFALGVLQGLASRGLLKRFDYLSTVSGGGYIGSWLSSWVRRHADGIAGVEKELAEIGSGPAKDSMPKVEPEARPIRHLREYSNYLTPRLGITSGDTWAFAALYLRNLIVNLLVIVPLLAVLLAIPRISAWALGNIGIFELWHLVVLSDVSLLSLFAYIGMARPVRQGSKGNGVPWPISAIPKPLRFILFCFVSGTGAAIGIKLTWAKWHSLTPKTITTIDEWAMGIGLIVAVIAMTVVPCVTYFWRYVKASYAERRESVADRADAANREITSHRLWAESLAAIVAMAGAAALYWFFSEKVFDNPLGTLPAFNDVSPFLLADQSLASPGLLYVCFAAPTVLFILFLQATVFVAGSSRSNEDYDREWWGRAGGWLIAGSIVWLLLSAISIFGPIAIYQFPAIVGALGGASGLVAILLGRSAKSSASRRSEAAAGKSERVLSIAVPLFCVFLLAGISWLTTLIIHKVGTEPQDRTVEAQFQSVITAPVRNVVFDKRTYSEARRTQPIAATSTGVLAAHAHLETIQKTKGAEILWILAIGAAAFLASFAVGTNRFSMQALYRNRLIRAYLGASRYDRDPDPVTGFDPYDNVEMYKLRPELLWISSFRDFDAFLGELRNGLSCTPEFPLSATIAKTLQETTRTALADAGTLEAVVARIENATQAKDAAAVEAAKTALENVKAHLPKTSRSCTRGVAPAEVLATAKKELKKRKEQLSGVRRGAELADIVIQDLNCMLIEEQLTPDPVPAARRSIANREVFDQTYAKWMVKMPRVERSQPARDANRMEARAPLHIDNTSLNLVGGKNQARQQRMAEPFTISPLHSGSAFVGYRDSRKYGSKLRGISLGTAVAISGAAASPNQGYHSSIPLAFLLTMFNVRLGAWLGNPGAAGAKTYGKDNPTSTVELLAREMVGETNDTFRWIYLSDGGHFENLALYEMVLRRCRYIVVSDGGCDPKFTFDDLGNAIRKIRMDFGIPIQFEKMPMRVRDEDSPWNYVAIGTIDYEAIDGPSAKPGTLIYLKPGYYSSDDLLPKDVVNYARECSDFPHESTADQWFSESQFESYRALGCHVVDHIAGGASCESVAKFAEMVASQAKTLQQTEYVPVVAERISIKGGSPSRTAVVLPTPPRPQP